MEDEQSSVKFGKVETFGGIFDNFGDCEKILCFPLIKRIVTRHHQVNFFSSDRDYCLLWYSKGEKFSFLCDHSSQRSHSQIIKWDENSFLSCGEKRVVTCYSAITGEVVKSIELSDAGVESMTVFHLLKIDEDRFAAVSSVSEAWVASFKTGISNPISNLGNDLLGIRSSLCLSKKRTGEFLFHLCSVETVRLVLEIVDMVILSVSPSDCKVVTKHFLGKRNSISDQVNECFSFLNNKEEECIGIFIKSRHNVVSLEFFNTETKQVKILDNFSFLSYCYLNPKYLLFFCKRSDYSNSVGLLDLKNDLEEVEVEVPKELEKEILNHGKMENLTLVIGGGRKRDVVNKNGTTTVDILFSKIAQSSFGFGFNFREPEKRKIGYLRLENVPFVPADKEMLELERKDLLERTEFFLESELLKECIFSVIFNDPRNLKNRCEAPRILFLK